MNAAKLNSFRASGTNRMVHEGMCWECATDFGFLIQAVLDAPRQTVKESAAKLVQVHSYAGKEYYIKHYRHDAVPLRSWTYRFKKSPAREEWELARKVEILGVCVVRHLAMGERRDWRGLRESVLITEGFASETLADLLWRNQVPAPATILAFVQSMHAAGLLQRDLHPGNILVGRAKGDLRLVDLDGAIIKPALSQRERDENLAYLGIYLDLPLAPKVRARARRLRLDTVSARSRRCLGENRSFGWRTFCGRRWIVRHPWLTPAIEKVLAAPDEFLAGAKLLKAGRSSTVGAGDGMVLKRYNLRRWLNPIKNLFRASRARKGYQRAYHLELLWVPTSRPLATTDERVLGFPVRSYFLMEEIPGAVPLHLWEGDKRAAARAVGQLLARLHHEGFSHRDLKDGNIVFDRAGKPHLIDLDGLAFVRMVPDARAAANLARLAEGAARWRQKPSLADRARFVVWYCRTRELSDSRWWWNEIGRNLGAEKSRDHAG